jgi:hypothetical protein
VSIMTNVILCFTNQTNHSPTRPWYFVLSND